MMGQGRMIKKLLGQHSNDNKSDASLSFESRVDNNFLRPNTSQSASHSIGAPLSSLDSSPDGNFAVVAGEKVFKILKVNASKVIDDTDLRPAITGHGSGHNDAPSIRDRLNISIAKWMHGNLDSTVITASPNGRLALYDIKRLGEEIEVGRIEEHKREVHSIAVNPHRYQQFVTACHDGTARLFDLNEPDMRRAQIFRNKAVFRGNSDAIRDISWSPVQGQYFACATNSGAVQLWDRRNAKAPAVDIKTAHSGVATSIAWHPDGIHVISGGVDRTCCVWDLSPTGDRRQHQKPQHTIQTPAPIWQVSWRPPQWSTASNSKRAAQIAVAYNDRSSTNAKISTIHIWDLGRKGLPYKEVCDFETSPSALLWHNRDLLWSVNRSGIFKQTDLAYASRVIDKKSLSAFDFSPSGEILFLLEERRGRARSLSPDAPEIGARQKLSGSQSQSPSGVSLGGSRSDSDEDAAGSFLGGRSARSKRVPRRQSARSINSLSTTPPSANGAKDEQLMSLEEAVHPAYKPQQVLGFGHAPSTARRDIYQYLSARHLGALAKDKSDSSMTFSDNSQLNNRLNLVLGEFARAAQDVKHFRFAQTWNILAYSMSLLLSRRAEHHRAMRLSRVGQGAEVGAKREKKGIKGSSKSTDLKTLDDETPRKARGMKLSSESLLHPAARSILTEEMESTSNMTTPLARPMRDSSIIDKETDMLSSMDDDELNLPPAAHSHSPSPAPLHRQNSADELPTSSSEGYDFYDMDSFSSQAIDINSGPQRKPPLRLEYDASQQPGQGIGRMERHDSAESFEMFSTSAESRGTRFASSGSSGLGSMPIQSHRISAAGDSSWESSGPSDRRSFPSYDSQESLNGATNLNQLPDTIRGDGNIDADEEAMIMAALADDKAEQSDEDESNPAIINKDFYPQVSDPSFVPEPIDPHILIRRTLQFEVLTGVLNASAMILALKPFLLPNTIDSVQASSILRQYHHRLTSMSLFTEATVLRGLAYPEYRSTYSQGLHEVTIGFACPTCHAPMGDEVTNSNKRLQKCNKCRSYLDGCAVCQMFDMHDENSFSIDDYRAETSFDECNISLSTRDINKETARLWWYCQGCGHGGHTSCMTEWHGSLDQSGPSEGCCPTANCQHPCLPGAYRDSYFSMKQMQASDQTGKVTKENLRMRTGSGAFGTGGGGGGIGVGTAYGGFGGVKRDEKGVGESRAVESVRGKLSVSGSSGGASGAGQSLERKKSVKVVAPGEEGRR